MKHTLCLGRGFRVSYQFTKFTPGLLFYVIAFMKSLVEFSVLISKEEIYRKTTISMRGRRVLKDIYCSDEATFFKSLLLVLVRVVIIIYHSMYYLITSSTPPVSL